MLRYAACWNADTRAWDRVRQGLREYGALEGHDVRVAQSSPAVGGGAALGFRGIRYFPRVLRHQRFFRDERPSHQAPPLDPHLHHPGAKPQHLAGVRLITPHFAGMLSLNPNSDARAEWFLQIGSSQAGTVYQTGLIR